jgi:predicted permease
MTSLLRLAFRSLAKAPGFTVIAILTLALGISMSTSAFSLANTFMLHTVPYPNSDQLVTIFRTTPQSRNETHAPANALDIRAACKSYASMAIYYLNGTSLAEPGQPAQQIFGINTTHELFSVLGIQPFLGRSFTQEEEQPGKSKVVILTHHAWVRRFGSDPNVINRSLRLDGETYTIIGVLPASFNAPLVWLPGPTEFVRPVTIEPSFLTLRNNAWFNMLGRLKDDVTVDQAQSELNTIASRLAKEYPKDIGTDGLRITDLASATVNDVTRGILWLMVVLSGMVLLIACANLASLQLARAFGRSREYAVRAALGANRRHLMTPLLVESLVLALGGGLLGILLASWTNDLIGRNLFIATESGFDIPVDYHVLVFALLVSLTSGLVFGLAPAWLASRTVVSEAIKEGSRGSTTGRSHQRLKSTLIVGELAAALVLIGVATTFCISMKQFLRREVGWNPDGLFAGYVAMPWTRYTDENQCRNFSRTLLERLSALPGVDRAVLSSGLPVFVLNEQHQLIAEGQAPVSRGQEPLARTISVSSDFFGTLQLPLVQGAFFSANLKPDGPAEIVVNTVFAHRMWPGENPIGKRIRFVDKDSWFTVVGVVGEARMAANLSEPDTRLQAYRPLEQDPQHYLAIALRTSLRPEALAPEVRKIVAGLDADIFVAQAGSLRSSIEQNLTNLKLVAANIGTFAFMGLLISAIGLYGVISQLTAQRTRDIGVRMALGAQYSDILSMILRQGALLLVVSLFVGVPGYFAANSMVHRTMSELPIPGLWLFVLNLLVLAGVAFLACWLPARRAARIDPVIALRAD